MADLGEINFERSWGEQYEVCLAKPHNFLIIHHPWVVCWNIIHDICNISCVCAKYVTRQIGQIENSKGFPSPSKRNQFNKLPQWARIRRSKC